MASTYTRRSILHVLGAGAAAAALPLSACSSGTREPDCTHTGESGTRNALHYVGRGPDPARHCVDCQLYVGGRTGCGTCQVFPGPVSPVGTCDSFARRA